MSEPTSSTAEDATRVATGPQAGLAPGETVVGGNYEVVQLIARSGMGEVYRARSVRDNKLVALKVIRPELAADPRVLELFHREADILSDIRNDAVVGYRGLFGDQGREILAMDYVDGQSLADRLRDGPLTVEQVRLLKDRLARGLAVVHDAGTYHRDLSPDNILLPGGDLERAIIIDFGIAKRTDVEKSMIGRDFAGKYPYASPEQLGIIPDGWSYPPDVDARSDVYSLGLVLAAAATGRALDMGRTRAEAEAARCRVPGLDGVPAALRPEIAHMLQPDPNRRPQSMRELFERLGAPQPSGRRRWPWIVLGGVVLAVVAVLVLYVPGWNDDQVLCLLDPQCESAPAGPAVVDTPEQPPVAEPTPPAGPPIDRAEVERQLGLLSCGQVEAEYGEGGLVLLSGVATPAEAAQLETQIRNLPGVQSVASQIQAQVQPFCGALGVLLRHAEGELELLIDRPGGIYHAGDYLTVTVRTPAQVSGHRQVDAFDHEGKVVHLSPNDRAPDTFQAAGTDVVLGESGWRIEVGEPFGPGLILGFLTREPLFGAPRPLVESADDYLRDLEQALDRLAGTGPVLGGARPIETRP